jgi:hypothetical protein
VQRYILSTFPPNFSGIFFRRNATFSALFTNGKYYTLLYYIESSQNLLILPQLSQKGGRRKPTPVHLEEKKNIVVLTSSSEAFSTSAEMVNL